MNMKTAAHRFQLAIVFAHSCMQVNFIVKMENQRREEYCIQYGTLATDYSRTFRSVHSDYRER